MNRMSSQTAPVLKIVAGWSLMSTAIGWVTAEIYREHGAFALVIIAWGLGAIGLLVHLLIRSVRQRRYMSSHSQKSEGAP